MATHHAKKCFRCGAEKLRGADWTGVRCPLCTLLHREYQRRRREALKSAGLCISCGKVASKDCVRCRVCRVKGAEAVRRCLLRKKAMSQG